MIRSIFHVGPPLLEKVLRAVLIYTFLIAALRLAGKRELAQLSTVDFILLLAVANAVQNGIQGADNSVTGNVVSATTLLALNAAVAWLLYHSKRARRLIEGTGTVLIQDGAVCVENCHREEISSDDLLVAIQRQGAADIAEVHQAVLEPSGAIVITRRGPSREEQLITALDDKVSALTDAFAALAAQLERVAPPPRDAT